MIAIEISGGTLVGVYCDSHDEKFVLIDWDDYGRDEENYSPPSVSSMTFEEMPEDTGALFAKQQRRLYCNRAETRQWKGQKTM